MNDSMKLFARGIHNDGEKVDAYSYVGRSRLSRASSKKCLYLPGLERC